MLHSCVSAVFNANWRISYFYSRCRIILSVFLRDAVTKWHTSCIFYSNWNFSFKTQRKFGEHRENVGGGPSYLFRLSGHYIYQQV
jgi:hypothetical protein